MEILIGPNVRRSLLDIVLTPAPVCVYEMHVASDVESATSDLQAALGLQKAIGGSRQAGGPEAQALDGRIREALGLLVSAQNQDGGWAWSGRADKSDRYTSARVVWALSLARGAGYNIVAEAFSKSLGYLRNQLAAAENSDYDAKAVLLHALATAGEGDFTLANRLHRDPRPSRRPPWSTRPWPWPRWTASPWPRSCWPC